MNTRRVIQRVVFIALTLAACSGLVILLVAAIGKRNHEKCRDYLVTIQGAQKNLFISEREIETMLDGATNGKIKGEPVTEFNLRKLELQLKENPWVEDANLYFDNREVLHVSVTENEPIARIFTTAGKSFYIDSGSKQMPLSGIMSARVPVFTNFPDKKILSAKDSVLLNDVKKTATFILNDSFWMAQTEQIDIAGDRNFELVPTIGNHIVRLGDGDDIERKFRRLLIFYQQVLAKTSFDKYKMVDVRYAGQVIGTKEKISRVDSVQLRKNVEKLLQEAKRMQQDTAEVMPVTQQKNMHGAPVVFPVGKEKPVRTVNAEHNISSPSKTKTTAKPKLIENKTEDTKPKTEDRKPKAVMPAKNE